MIWDILKFVHVLLFEVFSYSLLGRSDQPFENLCCSESLFFFFYKFIYLFIIFVCVGSSLLCASFLQLQRAGATLRCGAWAPSHCGGFACCRAPALGMHAGSVVVAHGLQSAGSVVVMHRLSCSAACGIFPDQGLNLCPLHW